PRVRRRSLALLSWPDGAATPVRRLSLAVDPSAPAPLALHRHGEPIHPSPLHRVRSTPAPAGLYRLLAGWSFVRQHAPWALAWGALGDLPRLPPVRLGGLVISPARSRLPAWGALAARPPVRRCGRGGSWISPAGWRIPAGDALKGAGLRRWRAAGQVPR